MNKPLAHWAGIFLVPALMLCLYHFFLAPSSTGPKVAFVKTGHLMEGYTGLQAAKNQLAADLTTIQANVDTLRQRAMRAIRLAEAAPADAEAVLRANIAQEEYQRFLQQAEQDMATREQELTGKALQEINEAVAAYGNAHGFDIIFGTTNEGSIMHGAAPMDVTQDVLQTLNQSATPQQ